MHLISYVSDSMIGKRDLQTEIVNIVDIAQRNNAAGGITGVLFYENDHFFQAIEGEEPDLRQVFNTIEQDSRHHKLNKLLDQPVPRRAFPEWSLDTFYVDSPELINPRTIQALQSLYVDNFGVDAGGLVEFIKKMIDEMDTFKILNRPGRG